MNRQGLSLIVAGGILAAIMSPSLYDGVRMWRNSKSPNLTRALEVQKELSNLTYSLKPLESKGADYYSGLVKEWIEIRSNPVYESALKERDLAVFNLSFGGLGVLMGSWIAYEGAKGLYKKRRGRLVRANYSVH